MELATPSFYHTSRSQLATPLLTAIGLGKLDHVKLLLQHNALITTTTSDWSPLTMAAYITDSSIALQMTQFLFDNYTDDELNVNFRDSTYQITALLQSLYSNNYDVAKLLLKHGADVNLCDKNSNGVMLYCIPFSSIIIDQKDKSDPATINEYGSYDNYYNNYYSKLDPTSIIDHFITNYPQL